MVLSTFGITIPSASTTLAQMSDYSSGMFDEMLTPALVVVGIIVGCLIVAWFPRLLWSGISRLYKRKNDYD